MDILYIGLREQRAVQVIDMLGQHRNADATLAYFRQDMQYLLLVNHISLKKVGNTVLTDLFLSSLMLIS